MGSSFQICDETPKKTSRKEVRSTPRCHPNQTLMQKTLIIETDVLDPKRVQGKFHMKRHFYRIEKHQHAISESWEIPNWHGVKHPFNFTEILIMIQYPKLSGKCLLLCYSQLTNSFMPTLLSVTSLVSSQSFAYRNSSFTSDQSDSSRRETLQFMRKLRKLRIKFSSEIESILRRAGDLEESQF